MRDALLMDLAEIPGIELITTYDPRAKPTLAGIEAVEIQADEDIWQQWQVCIAQADAVWLIAPETGGILTRLTALVLACDKLLLGSSLQAVTLTTSKMLTSQQLSLAGIATLATYRYEDWREFQPLSSHGWVAKLDDGAGCEDSAYFQGSAEMSEWMQTRQTSHILQPYQSGIPASISMLCAHGKAWLLSANRQKISIEHGAFVYSGSVLNGMAQYNQSFEHIAQQVAQAMPGLAGYVGIDVIVDAYDKIHVLEINPRLTTSYAGLHRAINCNPAKLVLDLLLYNEAFVMPNIAHHQVEVYLHA